MRVPRLVSLSYRQYSRKLLIIVEGIDNEAFLGDAFSSRLSTGLLLPTCVNVHFKNRLSNVDAIYRIPTPTIYVVL
jgi:hypothetical protein